MVLTMHSVVVRRVYTVLCVLVAWTLLRVLAAIGAATEVYSLLALDVLENGSWYLKLTTTLDVL